MGVKRKSTTLSKSSNKKSESLKVSMDKVKTLVKELEDVSSTKKYNNIATLLTFYDSLSHEDEQDIIKLRALTVGIYSVFEKLIVHGKLSLKKNLDENVIKIIKWLKAKYSAFIETLFKYLTIQDVEDELFNSFQIDILQMVMKLIRLEGKWFAPNVGEPFFSLPLYKRLISELLTLGSIDSVRSNNGINNDNFLLIEFQESYLSKYFDLKFYFVQESVDIIEQIVNDEDVEAKQIFYSNYLLVLKVSIYKDYETDLETNFTASPPMKQLTKKSVFHSNFESNWLQLLNSPLLESQYKQTLLILHKRIIPFFNNPTKLMDFLTDSYEIGFNATSQDSITISILALNGLFELMKNYNLEYPNFFENLYKILNNQLLHLNHKSRFFRMLDLFLSSSHLPSNLVASFIKRLSRLSLTAPPSGIVILVPFIYNLLKKHPTCMTLIHNTTQYTNYTDPFLDLESDPLKTNALESSLWELNTMMNHYHPNVASLAKIFTQPFNKYSYNLEDFLDWSYPTLLNSELNKRFKGDLSLEFEKFDSLLQVEKDTLTVGAYLSGWKW